jgi:hypothetical protein
MDLKNGFKNAFLNGFKNGKLFLKDWPRLNSGCFFCVYFFKWTKKIFMDNVLVHELSHQSIFSLHKNII